MVETNVWFANTRIYAGNTSAKVIPKKQSSLKGLGNPDLLVLFTGTVSHKLMRNALNEIKGSDIRITRSHTSSMSALKHILDEHFG